MLLREIPMVFAFVSDVQRSVDWYRETLELPVIYQGEGFASFQLGDQRLALHTSKDTDGTDSDKGTVPVFGVDDYPAAKATLESRGCVFSFENKTANAIFGSFRDPDLNPLQIMQTLRTK